MTDTEPPQGGLTFSAADAPIVIEVLEAAARTQLSARAENLLARIGPEAVAEFEPEEEQNPDERRRLRTYLLSLIGSDEGPGQMEYDVADILAAMPGDICTIVCRWLERAGQTERPRGRRHTHKGEQPTS